MTDPDPAVLADNVLRLEGSADVTVAFSLLEAARQSAAAPGDVTVDCAGLERLDAAGVQVLLSLRKTLVASGRALRMERVPERVFGMLLQTGLGQALVLDAAKPAGETPPPSRAGSGDAAERGNS